jgi:uncharacterized protein YcfJ
MAERETNTGVTGLSSLKSAQAIEGTQWTKYKGEKGGHGFAAEDANALNEQLKGKNVDKVGMSNEPNGPDRITNGVQIQTKYYDSAHKSIDAGFDKTTGQYRYEGQVLEVPSDQYDEAIQCMKQKIREGRVPGYTDPEKATELVKKGDVTYNQAKNIAKAGNIDSLWFDVKNQAVVTGCAFGISFIIVYAHGIWSGLGPKKALKNAFGNALKTGGVVLIVGVGTQQLLRTSIGRNFAALSTRLSRTLVDKVYGTKMGKDLIEQMASAILKKTLYGAAAKNAIARLMRSNVVTGTVTATVLTVPDAYRAIISRSISWVQFSKNFAVTITGVGGSIAGAYIGGAIGTVIAPGVGTTIGVYLGGLAGGTLSAIGTKKLGDAIALDDAKIMIETMNKAVERLCFDYMISETELEKRIIPEIQSRVTPKWLRDMYAYGGGRESVEKQGEYVCNELEHYFQEALKDRVAIATPERSALRWLIFKTRVSLIVVYLKMSILKYFNKEEHLLTSTS